MNGFSAYHPTATAVYFASVLLIAMFVSHPLIAVTAFLGGALFFLKVEEKTKRFKGTLFYVLFFAVVVVTNPLFSHNGKTVLLFVNGNPITLEALLYGLNLGIMLLAVLYWFKCFSLIMTADKLLYLCGRMSPKLALLLSSSLRFLPQFQLQADKIRQAQKAMGLYTSDIWTDKLRAAARVYSVLITWALEHAIDTGSSMKARGYGLKGRSHYALFTFRSADTCLLVTTIVLDTIVLAAMAAGKLDFIFYPSIAAGPLSLCGMLGMSAFALLAFLPFMLEVKEDVQWRYYRSKI